ncbi:CAP domain-containing protein [Nonomuraea sp. K274]|uniref:CAP domain-containing protein n=1 Tax=Nonomuraea cypriaca TaxID=1187855 RepID=A0A931ABQ8_9ACTN|nr:CAP domain-containing protein [Nonomuraea cypriaca]MBF8186407.1 CAP domain-containing protein [Nonomuraea cypriaca]
MKRIAMNCTILTRFAVTEAEALSSLLPFSRNQQRLVPKSAVSRRRQAAVAVTGALLLGLTGAVSLVQPAAAAAPPLKGAGTCKNIDIVYRPKSAFPDTKQGRGAFLIQAIKVEPAVMCLVNAERAAANLRPLQRFLRLKGTPALSSASARHAAEAVKLRWWGDVEPGKNCRPMKNDPTKCDPHINPQTGSTPLSRAQALGYGRRCASFSIAENAYVGWGSASVTPRAAVTWWMNSKLHRDTILNPTFEEMYTKVAWGSADPDAGSTIPALTYVQMFGRCS